MPISNHELEDNMLKSIISKRLGKDKLYRAIYGALDEIFEYRKEFKQKYPGKGVMAGKKKSE